MKVTMNMSNYEIEYETSETEYSDDLPDVGWNPEDDSMCQDLQLAPITEQVAMTDTFETEVEELFLRKMYSYKH